MPDRACRTGKEHYKYNEKAELTHPISKEKKNFNFDCSGFVAAVYWTSNIAVFEKQAVLGESGVKTIYGTLEKYKKIYNIMNQYLRIVYGLCLY